MLSTFTPLKSELMATVTRVNKSKLFLGNAELDISGKNCDHVGSYKQLRTVEA